jgi:hypothetical protein
LLAAEAAAGGVAASSRQDQRLSAASEPKREVTTLGFRDSERGTAAAPDEGTGRVAQAQLGRAVKAPGAGAFNSNLKLGAVSELAAGSMAPATWKAYGSDCRRFESWLAGRGSRGVSPLLVAQYLQEHSLIRGADGSWAYAPATLARWVGSINAAARAVGEPPPGADPLVKDALAEIRRTRGTQRKREPLPLDRLRLVLETISADDAAGRGWAVRVLARRDAAVLVTAWAGAFHSSELTAFDGRDAAWHPTDGLHLLLRSSRTNAGGEELVKVLPFGDEPLTCPVCAFGRWTEVTAAWDQDGRAGVMQLLSGQSPGGHICRAGVTAPTSGLPLFRSVHRAGLIRPRPMTGHAFNEMLARRVGQARQDPGTSVPARHSPAASRAAARQRRHPGEPVTRYAAEQARFADWCASRGLAWRPAAPGTVLAYLEAEKPVGGTAARWVAGIRAAHAEAGLPDPCGGSAAAWVRHARAAGSAGEWDVAGLAGLMPESGWPSGLRGQRDRVAFLLRAAGAIPASVLAGLPATAVAVPGPRTVTVSVSGSAPLLVRAVGKDPVGCPACAVIRWAEVLSLAARFGQVAAVLRRPAERGHLCEMRSGECPWPAFWPLLPAIDRWGALPLPPVPSMSLRAVKEMLRASARGTRAYPPQRLPPRRGEPQSKPAPPAVAVNPRWHEDGVAARARDFASMGGVDDLLDQLEAAAFAAAERARRMVEADLRDDN